MAEKGDSRPDRPSIQEIQMTKLTLLCIAVAASSLAAQNPFPLPASAGSTTATQNTAPFVIPSRMTQTLITDRTTLMGQGLPSSLNNWDMVAFDSSSRYIFVPCENFGAGGGLFRYDTQTRTHVTIWHGDSAGRNPDPNTFNPATDDTTANDPCTWTPWNTIIFGEEATGGVDRGGGVGRCCGWRVLRDVEEGDGSACGGE